MCLKVLYRELLTSWLLWRCHKVKQLRTYFPGACKWQQNTPALPQRSARRRKSYINHDCTMKKHLSKCFSAAELNLIICTPSNEMRSDKFFQALLKHILGLHIHVR